MVLLIVAIPTGAAICLGLYLNDRYEARGHGLIRRGPHPSLWDGAGPALRRWHDDD